MYIQKKDNNEKAQSISINKDYCRMIIKNDKYKRSDISLFCEKP